MSLQLTILTIDINEMTSTPMVEVFNKDIVSIGRKASVNDVVLSRSEISGKHLQIRVDKSQGKERIFVMDLGSLNGTTIEGKLLEPNVEQELRQGQRIGVGSYIIRPLIVEDVEEAEEPREKVYNSSPKRESTIIGDSGSDNSIDSSAKYFEMVGDFSFDSEQSEKDKVSVSSTGSRFVSNFEDNNVDNASHYTTNNDSFHELTGYEEEDREAIDSRSSYNIGYDAEEEDGYQDNENEDDIDDEGISEELVNPMEQGKVEEENDNYSEDEYENNDDIGNVEEDEIEDGVENDEDEYEEEVENEENVEEDVEEDEENSVEVSELSYPQFQNDNGVMKDENSTCDLIKYDFEGIELFSIGGRVIHNGKPFAGVRIDVGE